MAAADQAQKNRQKTRAKIRDDLIRRLFAVAISVGAATTLAQMKWVQAGRWPCLDEWQQLWILIAAMTATVLSWDGYLSSIADRPLRNFWRFAIDIFLVFVYMFLLMTSRLLVWWLFIHALIFAIYVVWDFLSVRDWNEKYYEKLPKNGRLSIADIYVGGLLDRTEVKRGPIITIVWAIYFWSLYFLNIEGLRTRIVGVTIFVVLGLWLYRLDKQKRFKMLGRSALVVILLLASLAFSRWGISDQTIWHYVGSHIGSASCGS